MWKGSDPYTNWGKFQDLQHWFLRKHSIINNSVDSVQSAHILWQNTILSAKLFFYSYFCESWTCCVADKVYRLTILLTSIWFPACSGLLWRPRRWIWACVLASTLAGSSAASSGCASGSTTSGPMTSRWPTTWRPGARRGKQFSGFGSARIRVRKG